MNRLIIWMKLLWWYLRSLNCNHKAKLLSAEETVEEVCNRSCSLIRLGDGELNCLNGLDVHYQAADNALKQELKQVIDYYIKNSQTCEYLLCMPNEFLKCSGITLARKRVWVSSWARFRYVFKKYFDLKIRYGDAFVFAKGYNDQYKKIWMKADNIIFVHNNEKFAKKFKEEYKKVVCYIEIPERDCYSNIDFIVERIKYEISVRKNEGSTMVLISAGPCGKVIVFRLKNVGVQVIDTGHCWDDPLHTR